MTKLLDYPSLTEVIVARRVLRGGTELSESPLRRERPDVPNLRGESCPGFD